MSAILTTLKNGLRIVTDTVTSVESVALGVWVGVGTRHEDLSENGVAHMVEHMLFKGTPTRSAKDIAEVMEDVGGNMNAYTGSEITAYYVHVLADHLNLGLDVLADLLQNSTLPQDEIERERGVILQEIKMYADSPDRLVFDYFQEAAYPNQALGASGLGRADIIRKMKRDVLMNYISQHYHASQMVISAAGRVDHDDFVARVESLFGDLPSGETARIVAANYTPQPQCIEKKLEQTHMVVGFQGVKRGDKDHSVFRLLSNILGGGMSSRLFQEIREKRGLVYSIYSFHDSFCDDGLLGIYAGTGPENIKELMPVLCDEIRKVSDHVGDDELARAKAQLKSGLLMGRESMLNRADQQARYILNYNRTQNIADVIAKIDAVESQDITSLAQQIFASQPTLAAIGRLKDVMSTEMIAEKIAA